VSPLPRPAALDNGFDIEPESISGRLGRNGAGKTTLMRIVAGRSLPPIATEILR